MDTETRRVSGVPMMADVRISLLVHDIQLGQQLLVLLLASLEPYSQLPFVH
jgi:hypothetical protein